MNASVTGANFNGDRGGVKHQLSATINASEVSAPCPNSVARENTVTVRRVQCGSSH